MLWNIKQLGFRFVKVQSKGIWIREGLLYMNNKMRTKHWVMAAIQFAMLKEQQLLSLQGLLCKENINTLNAKMGRCIKCSATFKVVLLKYI